MPPSRIRAMCDAIRHRGPDDEGFLLDGPCALGMRRLAIVDLASGRQPIANEDNTLHIVFNGEIYNHAALRRELLAHGHRFRTASDTEVILHLFEEHGAAACSRLRGMFAFALWDSRARTLFLARDRFGKKPLYLAETPEGLTFASELKSLRAAGIPLEQDRRALQFYLQFAYVPEPLTPFRNVRKLPAGSYFRIDDHGRREEARYWTLPRPAALAPENLSFEEHTHQTRALFDDAVRLRMQADVPVGVFLSGGLDSSAVTASMALQSDQPIRTFSIAFQGARSNELPYAAAVAHRYRTQHETLLAAPPTVNDLLAMVRSCDEPFADSAWLPFHALSLHAAQHVKVVLTGDGGDEIFAGYDTLSATERLDRNARRLPNFARAPLSALAHALPYSAYGKNYLRALTRRTAFDRYIEQNSAPWFLRQRLLHPDWLLDSQDTPTEPVRGLTATEQALYFEATARLTGSMLVKADRASMAASLEVRCPLLDHESSQSLTRPVPPPRRQRPAHSNRLMELDRLPTPAASGALRHGLSFNTFALLDSESEQEYAEIAEQVLSEFDPQSHHENFLAALMIQARWRIVRYCRLEAVFTQRLQLGHRVDSALGNILRAITAAERSYVKLSRELLTAAPAPEPDSDEDELLRRFHAHVQPPVSQAEALRMTQEWSRQQRLASDDSHTPSYPET